MSDQSEVTPITSAARQRAVVTGSMIADEIRQRRRNRERTRSSDHPHGCPCPYSCSGKCPLGLDGTCPHAD